MKRLNPFVLTIALIAIGCQPNPEKKEPQVGLVTDSAMVVSAHILASEVGKQILKQGGNAFDATVAVQFALAVVYPRAGNIGGGGFAVYRLKNGETGALDFREKAPLSAERDMYLDDDGIVIKGKSVKGHLAVGVPGSVDGMVRLHEKFGSLPWEELVQPAVKLAGKGYTLNKSCASVLNRFQEDFETVNRRKTYLNRNEPWQAGDSIYHKNLAKTLSLIRDNGRAGFYEGAVADMIVNESSKGNGIISLEDLSSYNAKWRDALTGEYRGHKIIAMPPPSSGGVALIQLLRGAEQFNFASTGFNSAKSIHQMVEIERRVYADRATHLGDMDFVEVPVEMLTSKPYNQKRFASIDNDRATPSEEIKEGNVEIIESVETTHFSIVDPQGNAVSVTTTINSYFGSKVLVEGAGFFLNNEMDDFSAKPGVPNQFGLVGAEANAIAPEKRMLSSMTPTIVEKDGQLKLVVGSPGGSTIITSVYQTILNVLDHGMTMQDAVDAPKFHSQWLPDIILFEEERFAQLTLDSLQQMGHKIEYRGALGKLDCILVQSDGRLEGGSQGIKEEHGAAGF